MKGSVLLEHPQMHDLIVSNLGLRFSMDLRFVSHGIGSNTDRALVDDLIEYILKGNVHKRPAATWPLAKMFGKDLFNHPSFVERVAPILDGSDKDCTPDVQANVLVNLGNIYPPNTKRKLLVVSSELSVLECYAKAAAIIPTLARAWHNVGWAMIPKIGPDNVPKTIDIGGTSYTAVQALAKCLELQPDYVRAWATLGLALDNAGKVKIHGNEYDRAAAFKQAADLGKQQ